jgi:hypothetical protein
MKITGFDLSEEYRKCSDRGNGVRQPPVALEVGCLDEVGALAEE